LESPPEPLSEADLGDIMEPLSDDAMDGVEAGTE